MPWLVRWLCAALLVWPLGMLGCGGRQSALAPAGRDAEQIYDLFLWMTAGAAIVWSLVIGLAVYAVVRGRRKHSHRTATLLIIGGGVVFPTVVLTILLAYGLASLPALLELGPPDKASIHVSAEQYWWRVRYRTPAGESFELANEIAVPVGARTTVALESPDVIHSFWVPSLGGKMDAIPGRTNHIALEPTAPGSFRGVCAEYCGVSHALMLFDVVAMEPGEYEAWLAHQAEPAQPPGTELARRGAMAFLSHGCGACHAVRGTEANGVLGPDLTHVGGRRNIAGVLSNDEPGFRAFITAPRDIKPGAHMPAFDMLSQDDIDALAAYLDGLK